MAKENSVLIIQGDLIHCKKLGDVSVYKNGFIVVKNGKITSVGDQNEYIIFDDLNKNNAEVRMITLTKNQILIPGLVDTHIHAVQYPNAGLGYDKPLLEWLDTYTYPLEKKYKNPALSKSVYDAVVKKTLSFGTTTACYFASMFHCSSKILVDSVIKHGQRAFVGKVNMTELAPSDYIEQPEETIQNTLDFVKYVQEKENPLVQPIVTPRFALSCDDKTMIQLAEIAKEYDLNIQTHISENKCEIQMVHEKYNQCYAKVYDNSQLLTKKTVLAHGVHLTDEELKLIAKKGSSISHCPESNNCLKSGLCDVKNISKYGIHIGLGTDISGGASPSIIQTMRSAISTSNCISFTKENYEPITWREAFYFATLGGAHALALSNKIGNFSIGKEFDALIVDIDSDNNDHFDNLIKLDPLEKLQKFIYLGDNKNVINVFINGEEIKIKQ